MEGKRFLTRTRIEALVVLCCVAGYVWEGFRLPAFYRMPGTPGPTVFPLVLGIAMAISAVWLILFPGEEAETETADDLSQAPARTTLADRWHFYLMWGLLLGYVFSMPYLGFVLSSSLLLLFLFLLLGERRWYLAVLLAVGFSLAIHFAFAKGLQIRLPVGILAGLL